ncbi:MAG: aminotransferase class I/II-fold pyridoxal phosphate-dependent enzyme [Deltaproteobacteria bacterium]|nr:aminotransferase class I/II-fold pyridoxal phosphate-dependent enzyme [Deltaproteobacteria bacterium]
MNMKFPWQEEWEQTKRQTLQQLTTPFPNPTEILTRTTLEQLPNIDRRTTFSFESVELARSAFAGETNQDIYLRLGNPTVRQLENMITLLEARHFCGDLATPNLLHLLAEAPVRSLAFSCGMAAISHTLTALLGTGDTMITDKVLYGCTDNLLNIDYKNLRGIRVVEVDVGDLAEVQRTLEQYPETKVIYFETPTNPTLAVRNVKAIAEIAAKYHALVVIDNTFATPCLQNPLRLGADIVIHSLTKYINGHGDVLGGSVTGPAGFMARNESGGLAYIRRLYGGVMDPGQAVSILRGIVSLPLRMEKHCDNAEKVIELLTKHPSIKNVFYPGLGSAREIASGQMRRFGGMVAFELHGDLSVTAKALNQVVHQEVGYIAVSLGLPYTVFEHPAGMTHFFVPEKERQRKGISDTLVRMSVGLEDSKEIIKTLKNILNFTV